MRVTKIKNQTGGIKIKIEDYDVDGPISAPNAQLSALFDDLICTVFEIIELPGSFWPEKKRKKQGLAASVYISFTPRAEKRAIPVNVQLDLFLEPN